jgi:hypothetical protein
VIMDELDHFIKHFSVEIPSRSQYQLLNPIRAAQVLSVLDFASLLGFEHNESYKMRSICLAAMGLQKRAWLAKAKYYLYGGRNIWQTIGDYCHRLLNSLKRHALPK